MRPLLTFFFLTSALWPAVTHQRGFTSPHYVVSYGSGGFESNMVWYVGQTNEVVYNISDVDVVNYTIALWQQSIDQKSAHKGPAIESKWAGAQVFFMFLHTITFEIFVANYNPVTDHYVHVYVAVTLPEDVQDSFNWNVQLYDFDLSTSNVFFLWLYNGSESNQGKSMSDAWSMTSSYFNISNEPVSDVVTSATSSSLSSSTTSASTQSTSSAATPSTAAGTTATSVAGAPTPSASGSTSTHQGSSGISTGAGIGIGVGVGLAAISAIACVGLVVWYKRRNTKSGQR